MTCRPSPNNIQNRAITDHKLASELFSLNILLYTLKIAKVTSKGKGNATKTIKYNADIDKLKNSDSSNPSIYRTVVTQPSLLQGILRKI